VSRRKEGEEEEFVRSEVRRSEEEEFVRRSSFGGVR